MATWTTVDEEKTILGRTPVQIDSTVIVSVLFFLTPNSYLEFLPEFVGTIFIGMFTLTAIIPFVISVFLIKNDKVTDRAKNFTMHGFVFLAVNLMAKIKTGYKRIVILDEDKDITTTFTTTLESDPISKGNIASLSMVYTSNNPEHFLATFEPGLYDLLFIDIILLRAHGSERSQFQQVT